MSQVEIEQFFSSLDQERGFVDACRMGIITRDELLDVVSAHLFEFGLQRSSASRDCAQASFDLHREARLRALFPVGP